MANQNESQDTIIQNQKVLLEAMSQIKSKIENPLNHDHIAELQRELEDTKKQVEDTKKQVEAKEKQVEAERKQVEATKLRLEEEKMSRRKSRLKRTAQTNENISTDDFTNTSHFKSIDGGDAVILGGTIVATEAVVGGMDSSSNNFTEFIIISKIFN